MASPELLVVGGGLVVLGVKAIEGGVNHLMAFADQIRTEPLKSHENQIPEELMWKLVTYPHDPRELMVYHQLSEEMQTMVQERREKEKAVQLRKNKEELTKVMENEALMCGDKIEIVWTKDQNMILMEEFVCENVNLPMYVELKEF